MLIIFLAGGLLDIANLAVAKNTMVQKINYYANTATIQGGLRGYAPYGWNDTYKNQQYLTGTAAKADFNNAMTRYSFITGTELEGTGLVNYKEQKVITGTAYYVPVFTGNFGGPPANLTHSAKFAGFWVDKTTQI